MAADLVVQSANMNHRCKPWEDEAATLVALGEMGQLPSLTAPGQPVSNESQKDRAAHGCLTTERTAHMHDTGGHWEDSQSRHSQDNRNEKGGTELGEDDFSLCVSLL